MAPVEPRRDLQACRGYPVQPMLQLLSLERVSFGGYLSPHQQSEPLVVPPTGLPMAKQISVAHLPLELNVCVELNTSGPDDEKQPWTDGALSVGAADGSSTPVASVPVAADGSVVVAAQARVADSRTTVIEYIDFIVTGRTGVRCRLRGRFKGIESNKRSGVVEFSLFAMGWPAIPRGGMEVEGKSRAEEMNDKTVEIRVAAGTRTARSLSPGRAR